MTLLFPAIKAEALIVLHAPDDTIRVMVDWHDRRQDVDLEAFFTLAIVNLLMRAKEAGEDPGVILSQVLRMVGVKLRQTE